ncbi:Retrovirus-related Pol polyprotein, partial [Mucuna pruriens]
MFQKVEINIPLLGAIKQVPKYAKFLKELCVHKRRKMKGSKEIGGVVSALTRNEEITVGAPTLPKKCRDPGIFSVPCTIDECTFADAMLDLGALINVMPTSIYRSLNFGDLEPTRMTIQLANKIGQTDPSSATKKSPSEVCLPGQGTENIVEPPEVCLPGQGTTIPRARRQVAEVLRQHKKAIGWKLANLPGINPSICMHRILMEEEISPSGSRIIYPISDSQWVSPVQVVPKKSGMTVMKNQQDELVPTRIQNSWRVCIDYRRLNLATRKDHFPLPFIDQMLEKLAGKSHYCFLDGFLGYMQIHIAPEDQHKTTFTCPCGTFAYTHMPFGLCNAPSTFQRCMMSIFSDLLQDCMEVFMDDFTVYADSFEACLNNLSKVLKRCIDTNLVLNFEKCHFMVTEGIVLGHLVSNRGIEVDKAKIDIITPLLNPTSVREVHSFLGHAGFYRRFMKNFSKLALPLSKLL